MRKLQFLGSSGTVTGSSYLLTGKNGETILIDLGMFQGVEDESALNVAPLSFDAKNLKGVLLTHAHLDHCGRLPLLVQEGFQGKIYTTEATKEITEISLRDALEDIEGVKQSNTHYAKQITEVEFEEEKVSHGKIIEVIKKVGYEAKVQV